MPILKILVIFLVFACVNPVFSFDDNQQNTQQNKQKKFRLFKKKEPEPKPKMVETLQEWEQEAVNIPLEDRKLTHEKPPVDEEKYFIPKTKYVFERYNYPQGKRELNFEEVKKNLFHYSYLIADNECKYAGYAHYYFSPDTNQISSSFFVEKLDTSKTKTKRILDYHHKQLERTPVVEAGVKDYYPNLYKGLSLVDWSKDSKKLLIKERVGSTLGGVYKTYLYVHYLAGDVESSKTIKLDDLDVAIKQYFLNWERKQIVKYRYDIEPLGFSQENDNLIILICYVYDEAGNKVYLGTWGYDLEDRSARLISKDNVIPEISVNGLILREVIN